MLHVISAFLVATYVRAAQPDGESPAASIEAAQFVVLANAICAEVIVAPVQFSEVLSPSTLRQAPPDILRDILISSLEPSETEANDGWVLNEQNLNRPTYGNMRPTTVLVPPPDSQFYRRRELRRHLYAEHPDEVFITTRAPQLHQAGQEILGLTLQALCTPGGPYIATYDDEGQIIKIQDRATREITPIKNSQQHPLLTAGLLSGMDWLVLRKNKTSGRYVVAGGFVASPYYYNLSSQVSRSLEEIHQGLTYKVTPPRSADADENTSKPKAVTIDLSTMIPRILSRLGQGGPAHGKALTRPAWFVTDSPVLSLHARDNKLLFRESSGDENFSSTARLAGRNIFLRVEREIMLGLTSTTEDYLVFGLQPYIFTLEQISSRPDVVQKLLEGLAIAPDRAASRKIGQLAVQYLQPFAPPPAPPAEALMSQNGTPAQAP